MLFNKAKGREMVTGLIAGYFANGLYQLLVLFALGSLIPFHNPAMVLPQGYGLRNTVDLTSIQYAVDDLIRLRIPMQGIETRYRWALRRRARLLSLHASSSARGSANSSAPWARTRTWRPSPGSPWSETGSSRPCSPTVFAAWGQLLFLQNMGTLNTYSSHEQVGMFAIAALWCRGHGDPRDRGTGAARDDPLPHALHRVAAAGKALAGDAQIGEYFRVFVAYAVITVALVLHAWQVAREARES